MNRRDTIILAVLVNAALLAILFVMATHVATEEPSARGEPDIVFDEVTQPQSHIVDEIDQAIQEYVTEVPSQSKPVAKKPEETAYIEITVKRGDFLEKIANANGTTVSAIKKVNNLTSDRLDIGQVLRLPKGEEGTVATIEYYTVESGDSPWKIARKFQVPLDQLLEMNSLDEAKARNIKAGDRLRVR